MKICYDEYMNADQRIDICKKTRFVAQKALLKVLQDILAKNLHPSESDAQNNPNAVTFSPTHCRYEFLTLTTCGYSTLHWLEAQYRSNNTKVS